MQLIAGLGNPGPRYQATRHNIGFMAVEAIARRHNFSPAVEKFHGEVREGWIAGRKIWLFTPMTFMNRSGEPLGQIARFYKIAPEDVAVIYDELDLPLGKIRAKQGGGHGGHNGLKSIDTHFGKDYYRIRLGIDHPGDKSRVTDHVLSDFRQEEWPVVNAVLDAVADHAGLLAEKQLPEYMNKITLALRPFLPEKTAGSKTVPKEG